MTQINLTLNLDNLKDQVLNSELDSVLKSTLVLVLNEIMEKEREDYLNAKAYERTEGRADYRSNSTGCEDEQGFSSRDAVRVLATSSRSGLVDVQELRRRRTLAVG